MACGKLGGKAIAVSGDVTKEEYVQNAIKTAVNKFEKLDIAVNSAGVGDVNLVTETDDDIWEKVLDVNLTGPMRVFRAAIPEMLKSGGGSFVTLASVAGIRGARGGVSYTTSKHGVIGLAKNVAFTYADKNIRSNVIAPGYVDTEMIAALNDMTDEE